MATLGLTEASRLSESEHQVQLRRAVIASTIGTAIVVRLLSLQHDDRASLREAVLPAIGAARRHPRGFCCLCRGLRCPAGGCCDIRPLWRPHRTQIHAYCNPDAHGHRDVPGVAGADL